MNKKVLSKIKKLMKLAESNNPNEAAAALAKAQELMAEHQVSDIDVKLSEIAEVEKRVYSYGKTLTKWETVLINTVAQAFGIEPILSIGWNSTGTRYCSRIRFIGHENRIQTGAYVYEVLLRNISASRKQFMDKNKRFKMVNRIRMADAFCLGYINQVSSKVVTMAIPFNEKNMIQLFKERMYPETKKSEGREIKTTGESDYAFIMGSLAGMNDTLHAGMGASTPLKQLGE